MSEMLCIGNDVRLQPLLLATNRRLECKCGALAIIVTGTISSEHYNALEHVDVWCQSCFADAQERESRDDPT